MQNICGSYCLQCCCPPAPCRAGRDLTLLSAWTMGMGWLSASTGRVKLLLRVTAVTAAAIQTNLSIDHLPNPSGDHRPQWLSY